MSKKYRAKMIIIGHTQGEKIEKTVECDDFKDAYLAALDLMGDVAQGIEVISRFIVTVHMEGDVLVEAVGSSEKNKKVH